MPKSLSSRLPCPTPAAFFVRALPLLVALSAGVLGCASPPTPEEQVVRSNPPHNSEAAITSYFDVTVRGGDKNRELTVGTPQRGSCPMGGTAGGYVGWVVPVEYKTRSKDNGTVVVTSYFFWFSDETIRGVTRRMEVCP